jgi:hypothetical protein
MAYTAAAAEMYLGWVHSTGPTSRREVRDRGPRDRSGVGRARPTQSEWYRYDAGTHVRARKKTSQICAPVR